MTKTIEQFKDQVKRERTIVLALSAFGLLLIFSYIFLIHGTIYNIVTEKRVVGESEALGTELVALERDYFAESSRISLELAQELGFQEVKSKSSYFVKAYTPSTVTIR
ncbi:MAG TPA: hypothetical protein VJJ24_01955 [Candidatus Paceibacterota bacterium]